MQKSIVGEAGNPGECHCATRGDAAYGQRVEVGELRVRNAVGNEGGLPVARPAHVLQYGDLASVKTAGHQAAGNLCNGAAIGGQHDQPHARLDEGLNMGGVAAMEREGVTIGE